MLSAPPKLHDAKPPKKKQKSPQSKRAFCWLSTLTSKERPVSAVLEYIRKTDLQTSVLLGQAEEILIYWLLSKKSYCCN
jgi:hypothetical protein